MKEIVNHGDIVKNGFNQKNNLQETAAELGAIILEMEREIQCYGEHTDRMAELKMLEKSVEEPAYPKNHALG